MPTASHPCWKIRNTRSRNAARWSPPLKPSVSSATATPLPPAVLSASASPRTLPSRWRSVFSVTTRWPRRHAEEPDLFYAAGQGDGKRGLNHFGHEGLVRRVVGGHWGWYRSCRSSRSRTGSRATTCRRASSPTSSATSPAANRRRSPGRLGTFVDPRYGGGKINDCTTEDLVSLINVGGEDYLMYKTFPVNVGIIRGTTADPDGNITMEKEALTLEALAIAMAAHNSGGIVIVQVERVAERGSLNPRQVKIPGILVDCGSSPRSPNITCRLSPRPTALPSPARSAFRCRRSRRWRWMNARSSPVAPPSS